MSPIETYLEEKGWSFKFKNGEFCLNFCPLCQTGPGHFYINQAKEIFYCHKCNERGHILSLKKRLGDLPPIAHISEYSKRPAGKTIDLSTIETYQKALQDNPAAFAYLTQERGFTPETIRKFKLGFHDGAIAIPLFQDGVCLNVKYRKLQPGSGNKYLREEGFPSILFNLDTVKGKGWIVLTEGEFDAIAFDQLGFSAVAVTGGVDTFLDECIDPLECFEQIFISYDMDEPGRKGAEKAADKLGRYRAP